MKRTHVFLAVALAIAASAATVASAQSNHPAATRAAPPRCSYATRASAASSSAARAAHCTSSPDHGNKNSCAAVSGCSSVWPSLKASGRPTAGSGVKASLLSTTSGNQVTYAGHPLYTYSGDSGPGETSYVGVNRSAVRGMRSMPLEARSSSLAPRCPTPIAQAPGSDRVVRKPRAHSRPLHRGLRRRELHPAVVGSIERAQHPVPALKLAGGAKILREGIPRRRSHTGSARKAGRALIAAAGPTKGSRDSGRARAVIRKPSRPIPRTTGDTPVPRTSILALVGVALAVAGCGSSSSTSSSSSTTAAASASTPTASTSAPARSWPSSPASARSPRRSRPTAISTPTAS